MSQNCIGLGQCSTATPVIGFIDCDSFECQLYQRERPDLRGKPCIVTNASGRVLAATHEAKQIGINRTSTPNVRDIKKQFPSVAVHEFRKETRFGKPDTIKTRHGTWEILDAVKAFCSKYGDIVIELASSDEIYLDISTIVNRFLTLRRTNFMISMGIVMESRWTRREGPFKYFMVDDSRYGPEKNYNYHVRKEEERLVVGAEFIRMLVNFIYEKTNMQCSGGVSNNKLLSKLGCGLNKPAKITILTQEAVPRVSKVLKVTDIPGLGGIAGEKLKESYQLESMLDLKKLSIEKLSMVLDAELSERIFSLARGRDNSPVVQKLMKDRLRINKAKPEISRLFALKETIRNLIAEMKNILDDEAKRHERTATEIKVEFAAKFSPTEKEEKKGSTTITTEILQKADYTEAMEIVLSEISKVIKDKTVGFQVTELGFNVSNFVLISTEKTDPAPIITTTTPVHNLTQAFKEIKVSETNELRVKIKPQKSDMIPKLTNRIHLGSFRTTRDGKYSTNDLGMQLLQPMDKIQQLIGKNLGEGYKEDHTRIIDHNKYYEIKHKCFINWLEETGYLSRENQKPPDFITFSGRFADPLKTPVVNKFGDWAFYGVNINGIIWIWDEKLPRNSDKYAYYGTYFEKLVIQKQRSEAGDGEVAAGNTNDEHFLVNEADMLYQIDQVDLGKHTILLVNQIDAVKENGEWIEITQLASSLTYPKALRLWTQLTTNGVNKVLVGIKDFEGNLLEISEKSLEDLVQIVGIGNTNVCLDFQNRLLKFIKNQLKDSDPMIVKRFSWVNGNRKVLCEDFRPCDIPTLVFPKLYYKFLNVDFASQKLPK